MNKTRYAVLGAGNGGQCISAYLSLRGYDVSLYDRYENVIDPLEEKGSVELKGVSLNGIAKIDCITTDIEEAADKRDVLLVVVPAYAHEYIAGILAPVLKDGQVVVLCPGSTGGVLEFKRVLKEKNCTADIRLAQTSSLFYACRLEAPGIGFIGGIKKNLPLAALPSSDAKEIIGMLREPYPQLIEEENILVSDMSNLNAVIHPIPVLLNTGWIEATKGDFKYYYDSITPSIGEMIEKMDLERIKVCDTMGIKVKSVRESLFAYYDATGGSLYEAVRNVKAYERIKAPSSLQTRLLLEDVPMGLVPMSELGKLCKVETPIMDMVIGLTSYLLQRDFKAEGRNLKRLGVESMGKEELLTYLKYKGADR
jgi:opine dehydrogenase